MNERHFGRDAGVRGDPAGVRRSHGFMWGMWVCALMLSVFLAPLFWR